MPDAIGVGLLTPPGPTPSTNVPAGSDPSLGGFLPPVVPPNQLQIKPYSAPQMGSGPVTYSAGPNQLQPWTPELGAKMAGQDQGQSAISHFVSGIESSYGKAAHVNQQNNPTMVDYTYGQYPAFGKQYGTGASGVDNYAQQVLKANPNATLGDFYSGYVLGTGDPSKLPGADALRDKQPTYYNNLVNVAKSSGYGLDTPLSSLMGNTSGNMVADVDQEGNVVYHAAPSTPQTAAQTATGTDQWGGLRSALDTAANQETSQAQQAQQYALMKKLMTLASLKNLTLQPVAYNPYEVSKAGDVYKRLDRPQVTGLPHMTEAARITPAQQPGQGYTALAPRLVSGALGRRGPPGTES